MSPSRFVKRLSRRLRVSWREQLTQQDVEALQANIERVGLVIRLRWALVAALTVFSLIALAFYAIEMPAELLWRNMRVPGATLAFVLAYNTYYLLTYRRLGNIAILNHAQLLFDVLVATVLVYYSGGVYSWFQAMYLLFILEAAFILPRGRDVWIVAVTAMSLYGFLIGGEYFEWIRHVDVPFVDNGLHHETVYVAVRFLWGATMMAGSATIASVMMSRIHRRELELASQSSIDETTGLCKRREFERVLELETRRAARTKRALAVVLVDLDYFAVFNRLFGFDAGDRMLRKVGDALREAVDIDCDERSAVLSSVCRYGGEEFAVLVTEERNSGAQREANLRHAELLGEVVRQAVASAREQDGSVTASVGVACFPSDGASASELLAAADRALAEAVESGGNQVRTARACLDDAADA